MAEKDKTSTRWVHVHARCLSFLEKRPCTAADAYRLLPTAYRTTYTTKADGRVGEFWLWGGQSEATAGRMSPY